MEHGDIAISNFCDRGLNCSQAVLCTYCERLGLDEQTALRLSAPFGGGIGRQRETCGAVSGAIMVLGLALAPTDPTDREAKAAHYRLVQDFCARFREHNGSTVCRELLGGTAAEHSHIPEERTAQYYATRPCARLCADAAWILDDMLRENGIMVE